MNIAVVYYSLTGHSKSFAEGLSKRISCDIFQLKTHKSMPKRSLLKHTYCSIVACLEQEHTLEKISFDSDNYDLVILITPIWFGKLPPAYNTFFKENIINCEIIMVYSCFIAFSHLKVIYDQRPKSYLDVIDKILHYINQQKYSIDSREIHYNLLYE